MRITIKTVTTSKVMGKRARGQEGTLTAAVNWEKQFKFGVEHAQRPRSRIV